ncbi:hypothetical protein GBA52_015809 [Prunus armeniaca]|nr:hypothetical protein GBA52_015809 [Prunus armeniaca]
MAVARYRQKHAPLNHHDANDDRREKGSFLPKNWCIGLPSLVPEKATGVDSGSSRLKHMVASELSVMHLYEIAKVKQADP